MTQTQPFPNSIYPNLFSSPAWLKTLMGQYNFDYFCMQQKGTDNFLPAAKIEQFGAQKIKVFPFCDYIIPSAVNNSILNNLIKSFEIEFPELPLYFKFVLPQSIREQDLPYPFIHSAYRHTVDTSLAMDEIERTMDNSFMRGVRKAASHDINISLSTEPEALHKFYEIYGAQRISKFKKLPQPFTFFRKLRTNFMQKENGFILEARKGSTVIASMIILAHHQKLYYKFGCSVQKFLDYRPNNMLFHQLFKFAQENGFNAVDLGLSGVSDDYKGLVRFKEYMGGKPSNIYSLVLNEGKKQKAQKQLNKFMTSLTETIVAQQPDAEAATALSEKLYPYFA